MTKNKSKITAMSRKVNRPRLSLRADETEATRDEKCAVTTLFWAASVGLYGLHSLNPKMMAFNLGSMFHPEGYKNLTASTLKELRQYLKNHHIKDWTR